MEVAGPEDKEYAMSGDILEEGNAGGTVGRRMRIVNLSIQSTDAKMLVGPVSEVEEELGINIDLFCANAADVDEDVLMYQRLVAATEGADFVFIRCMSDPGKFKWFERYEAVLRSIKGRVLLFSGNAEVRLLYRDLFNGSDQDFFILCKYFGYRGHLNDKGIILWAYKAQIDPDYQLPEPVKQRPDGIYHPDFDKDVSFEKYLRHLKKDAPTAGIMMMGNVWVYDNLEYIDVLIRELEGRGMNVIPIFFSAAVSSSTDLCSTADVCERYFMDEGRPRVDVLIINSPFSQLANSKKTSGMFTPDEENFFRREMNVPVIQAMTVTGHYRDYEECTTDMTKAEVSSQVAWPEVDGQIIAVPIGCSTDSPKSVRRTAPIQDRIEHIAALAYNWARLGRTPVSERKVAILMYQSRPDSGRIGNAASLDVIESVYEMLKTMRDLGYSLDHVPGSSRELIDEILENVTNDFNWMPPGEITRKAADLVGEREYRGHFDKLSDFNKRSMMESWGKPPGEICVEGGKIVIPGLRNGNVFIGYQPLRGWAEQSGSIYHDPVLAATHQYLEYYRWLQYDFGAHAVVHMGTHGTLEWLPGKSVGMSSKCYPDIILNAMPHIYPYVIDDPGEGIQAKRRSEAVLIGHLNATMARAGEYDDLAAVDVPLQEYFKCKASASDDRKRTLVQQIYEASRKASLLNDLNVPDSTGPESFEGHLGKLHDYLTEVKDALVRDGLHVLGRCPREHHLDEAVYSLTRLANGDVPSLRDSLGETMGVDTDAALNAPSELSGSGELNSALLDRVDDELQLILSEMRGMDYDTDRCVSFVRERHPNMTPSLTTVLGYICGTLVPNLKRTSDEITHMMGGFEGKYVLPGPSGAPTRGNAHILPMGRNYYGIDPDSIPTPASWATGVRMADQMIEHYISEKGTYPREIGFIIWATDTMKTGGDDVAYILWLMGVRPVWSRTGGQVIDLEIIPPSELKRPRIDVTVRITGLFRDTFPNLIDMIDDAVHLISDLDETDEENYLAANLRRDIIQGLQEGIAVDEVRRRSSVRIFGCPPGAYGPGVNHAIESSDWETVKDLADIYIAWGSCAYGRGINGESMKDEFIKRFGKVSVTVKNMPDREIDLFDMDDVYGYLGGLNAFVRQYGNPDAMSVMGDGSNPERLKIRDTKEECRFVFRSKVLNPKFINGLKEHGYRGAAEMANLTEYVFGWDATSDVIDDWMYEQLAEKYALDQETKEWMTDVNPHALMNIISRLQEAIERGLWDASDEMRERLKDLFIEAEGRLEEISDR